MNITNSDVTVTPRTRVSGILTGIPISEYLVDAGVGNTVLGVRVSVNPLDIITARDNFIAKNGDSVLILPGQIPYSLISNYSISLISLLALSTATGTIATTPDTTLFGVAPAEGTTATVANAMRSPVYNNALTGKEVTITLSPAYSSGRYAILRVEVSGND